VFTANKRPLEELFGVDLTYLNKARGALVIVQYNTLEHEKRSRRPVVDHLCGVRLGSLRQGRLVHLGREAAVDFRGIERCHGSESWKGYGHTILVAN
jgi:hypothetical protein